MSPGRVPTSSTHQSAHSSPLRHFDLYRNTCIDETCRETNDGSLYIFDGVCGAKRSRIMASKRKRIAGPSASKKRSKGKSSSSSVISHKYRQVRVSDIRYDVHNAFCRDIAFVGLTNICLICSRRLASARIHRPRQGI
jgi:hypothetical protein